MTRVYILDEVDECKSWEDAILLHLYPTKCGGWENA